MAAKKRRKKASSSGKAWHKAMMAAKAAKHGGKKRAKKKTSTRVAKKSSGSELSLLQNIEKKVTRIDRTVNAGMHLAHKAKRQARRDALSSAFEEAQREGTLAE